MNEPQTFEQATSSALRTLTSWCIVLSAALILAITISVYGFARATSANSAAQSVAGVAANAARHADGAASRARTLAAAIQQQRIANIRSACKAQDARNTATIKSLDFLLARAERHARPAGRRRLRTNRRATVLLINALAPYQKCDAVVKAAIHQH